MNSTIAALCLLTIAAWAAGASYGAPAPLKKTLRSLPFRIAWECYVNDNWEIFVMNADGSKPFNLTKTPHVHEHYPQISPDGTRIAFSVDTGEGRDAIRSLWVMDINGKHRKKIADYAREPFWSPDSKTIGYLHQEYPRFDVTDFYTKGMEFYDLRTGKSESHPDSARLHHLYNPSFSRNGKWIAATVHAGMGFEHAIVLIEAHGDRIINLNIPGCRPCLSPDCKHIAWGASDNELAIAPINLDSDNPVVGPWSLKITDAVNKIYHIYWSPDSRFVAFSRGPNGDGDPGKKVSFQAANEIVGVYAAGWNICAVSAERTGTLDLATATEADFAQLTTNGDSNKEPAWFRPRRR
jgi:Tol biopolymer transport system component